MDSPPADASMRQPGAGRQFQLLLSQAGSGSFATTLTPWMVLVNALRTVVKAVELSPAPLIAATIAFFSVSIFPECPECFVFMSVFFRF